MLTVIPASTYRRMPWKNGQGETTEIAVEPAGGSFLWRLSIADVARSGPFSAYPGIERWVTVLSGSGMRLTIGEDAPRLVRALDPPVRFSGGAVTSCELLAGAIRDFNLMLDHDAAEGQLAVLRGPLSQRLEGETVLLHAVTGSASVSAASQTIALPEGDTARLDGAGGSVTLGAGATAILAVIARRRPT